MNDGDLLVSIRCIVKAYEGVLKKICTEFDLNLLEVTVISFLHNNPQMNTAGDIAGQRLLSKGNLSQAIERLIRRGLMKRMPDTIDRRRVYLYLLPAAAPVTDALDREWKTFNGKLFYNFTEQEIEWYDSFKEKLMQNAKAIMEETIRNE